MIKKLWFVVLLIAVLGLTLWVTAQVPDKAVDPVCGMTVSKDGAKWTYDYNGTTYYFCSEGCKTSFSKEPQKYLAKMDEAKKMGDGMGMMGGMGGQGQGMMHGQGQGQIQGGMGMMPELQNMRGQLMRMRNEIDMMMQRMRMMAGRMQGGMGEMQGGMMGGMMGGMGGQGQGMRHEQMAAGKPGGMECPMMMEGVDRKIENTKSGVIVTLTSKDSEMVKKLQEHMARMKASMSGQSKEDAAPGACPGCPSSKIK